MSLSQCAKCLGSDVVEHDEYCPNNPRSYHTEPQLEQSRNPDDAWKWIPTSFNVRTLSMPVILRTDTMLYVRLPQELWRSCGACSCPSCKANNRAEGWWDTLAIPLNKPEGPDYSFCVHMPERSVQKEESNIR